MRLIAGFGSKAPDDHNTTRSLALLAREHPLGGRGAVAATASSDGFVLAATGENASAMVAASERFILVADARLDDRPALRLALTSDPGASDADLLLAAWEKWGVAATDRVIGDYACAIWSRADRHLFLIRDALGQRPLFFTASGSTVGFASCADAFDVIAASYGQPAEDALVAHLAFEPPGASTLYAGVERVRPGEIVTIADGWVSRTSWWRPSTQPDPALTPREAVERCPILLRNAVAERVADAGPALATHLSAGLDSSVVTALAAASLPTQSALHAFTAIPGRPPVAGETRLTDESALAALAAAALPRVNHHLVPPLADPLAFLDQAAELYQQPLPNPYNHGWVAAINDAARRTGASHLLLGQFGNFTFSMAGERHRLARRLVRWWRGARRPVRAHSLLAPAISDRLGRLRVPTDPAERRLYLLRANDPGAVFKGFETGWGLIGRDPFADRRLAEFALAIPNRTLLALGDRGLGRPVAATLLPAAFVAQRARGYQSADWVQRFAAQAPRVRQLVADYRDHALAARLFDLDSMAAAADRLDSAATSPGADDALYRHDLPGALATLAFINSLAANPSRAEAMAWQGARL